MDEATRVEGYVVLCPPSNQKDWLAKMGMPGKGEVRTWTPCCMAGVCALVDRLGV